MTTYTCSTCSKEWPENYCPECSHTITRPPPKLNVPQSPPSPASNIPGIKADSPRDKVPTIPASKSGTGGSLKARLLGSLVCLCLGLTILALSYFLPIHWAKANPHERTTISTQLLVLGSMLAALAFPLAFGFGQNKWVMYIFAGIGVVIGFIFRVMLVETLTHIANGP